MAISKAHIKALVESYLQGSDSFLVDVLVKQGNVITIILDDKDSITIEDCIDVSRFVEGSLDREKEDFELKVMSAGADSPFQDQRQYWKNIGKKVKLVTREGNKYQGILTNFDEESVTIEMPPKMKKGQLPGKNRMSEFLTIPFKEVQETKLVISL